MLARTLFLFCFIYCCVQCEKTRFDNYSLYKIVVQNDNHKHILQNLYTNDVRFDFWNEPSRGYALVLSSPANKEVLENILSQNQLKYEITVQNIQEIIDKEPIQTYTRNSGRNMQWNAYYTLEGINAWIDDLVRLYPNITSVIIGGQSYEGRQIKGIKISHGSGKKIVFIEGGIHAREWISPATVNYITNELLTSTDPETMQYAREFDWYIFPVTNPDGYEHSVNEARMWRKNRRPLSGTNYGVDLNRNWDHYFLVHGSSTNESMDNYAGPYPFSEPESRTLSNYIQSIGANIELYLSFHSFGELLLIPFGNTSEPIANYHDAMNIGRRAMGAISVRYGTMYTTGNIAEAIYLATGGSVDWVKESIQVPLVYCYELRDRGTYGFLLPPEQILPNSQETMDSLVELIHQAKRFGYMLSSGSHLMGSVFMMSLVFLRYFV